MPHGDNEFADFIVGEIGSGEVAAKRMFGGFGLYRGETFFGIVYDGRVYFKTNARTKERYLKDGMAPFRASATQVLKNYYEVPEDALDDRERLREYAEEAWRIASTR